MRRHFSFIILLVCVIAFALGVGELFRLRFEAGDVYPPYSSLRSDPLGASGFYESLGRVAGISVSRDFRMTDEMPEGRNIAYLQLAGNRYDWDSMPDATFVQIESFMKRGGRLVIAFFPENSKPEQMPFLRSSTKNKGKNPKNKPKTKDNESSPDKSDKQKKKLIVNDDEFQLVSLKDKWGVEFGFKALKQGEGNSYETLTVENDNEPSLPASVAWHSGMFFKHPDKSWRVVYSRGEDPVLIERKFGAGSLVFSSDSFFLSNEALENDRHPDLLAWIIGPCRQVMFDEAHLGIVDNPGVATLVRKYRLHGLVAGLLLLAALFIWKNSVSFVPKHLEEDSDSHVAGKDSAAGFINLLRRHVSPRDVLGICLTEWKKSFGKGKISAAKLERVQAIINAENALPPKDRRPVRTYQAICQALKTNGTQQ